MEDYSMYDNIVVVIPAFNPDCKMNDLVRDLDKAGLRQIVLVDDGSVEECLQYFERAQKEYGCRIFHNAVNMGKGRALKNGFNYVLNEYPHLDGVITADSDGQHTAEDIRHCADLLLENRERKVIFLGSRDFDAAGIPARSRFGNKLTRAVLNLFCGVKISDTQTGLRGTGGGVLRDILCCIGERYEYEMNMLIEASEKEVVLEEFPISTIYIENNSSSHFHPVIDSLKIYRQFLSYALTAFSSFLLDFGLFALFSFLLKRNMTVHYIMAATYLARLFSSVYNFCMNRQVVFKSSVSLTVSAVQYFVLCLVQGTVSGLFVSLLYASMPWSELICKILADTVLFFVNFVIQKRVIFRKNK